MDIQGYPGIFRDIHGLSMDIPSRPLPLYVVIAREVDGQVGMPAGPPCFGKQAEACAANPSRPSQYKLIPAEICEKFGLPPGSCVCKSKDCWRVFGMAEPKKLPGRPSAAVTRAREECLTPVFSVSTSSRSKPAIVVKIHSFKDSRCRPSHRRAARLLSLCADCVLTG